MIQAHCSGRWRQINLSCRTDGICSANPQIRRRSVLRFVFRLSVTWHRVNLMPNTHRRRRRDSTVELSRESVGGVYWTEYCSAIRKGLWTNAACNPTSAWLSAGNGLEYTAQPARSSRFFLNLCTVWLLHAAHAQSWQWVTWPINWPGYPWPMTYRYCLCLLICYIRVAQKFGIFVRLHIHIYWFKKVDKRNLNRESYIDMHTVNYLGLVQIQIHIYSSGHME